MTSQAHVRGEFAREGDCGARARAAVQRGDHAHVPVGARRAESIDTGWDEEDGNGWRF